MEGMKVRWLGRLALERQGLDLTQLHTHTSQVRIPNDGF